MKRVALYIRVSTEEQNRNGLSVDNQIDSLKEYAKENDYTVVNVYNDAGISARKSFKNRPALLQLLEDVKERKIDTILFTKLDRWFRSVSDYYDVQRVLDEYNVTWKAIWEDYDTITSAGVFKVNIMLSVAQSEADRTSERVRAVFEYKQKMGHHIGGYPIGYKCVNHKLVADEETKEGIHAFFDKLLKTLSLQDAYRELKLYGINLHYSTVCGMIKNPVYCADNSHTDYAYITKEQFEIINSTFSKKHNKNNYEYIFKGLVYCGNCGGRLHSHSTISNGKRYVNYSCFNVKSYDYRPVENVCKGASIPENKLEEFLLNSIDELIGKHNIEIELAKGKVDNTKKIKSNTAKMERLKTLYEMGDISINKYVEKRDKLKEENKQLEKSPRKIERLSSDWKDIYNKLDAQHRRVFWANLIEKIVIDEKHCKTPKIFFRYS